jgi:hypothetical protein
MFFVSAADHRVRRPGPIFLFAAQDRFRISSLICFSIPPLPSLQLQSDPVVSARSSVLTSLFIDSAREAPQSESYLLPASSSSRA